MEIIKCPEIDKVRNQIKTTWNKTPTNIQRIANVSTGWPMQDTTSVIRLFNPLNPEVTPSEGDINFSIDMPFFFGNAFAQLDSRDLTQHTGGARIYIRPFIRMHATADYVYSGERNLLSSQSGATPITPYEKRTASPGNSFVMGFFQQGIFIDINPSGGQPMGLNAGLGFDGYAVWFR